MIQIMQIETCNLPFTVRIPATLRITSLGEVQPDNLPVKLTPITFGHFNSHGISAITSTASAPPTPIQRHPRPPPFGVWESVPNHKSQFITGSLLKDYNNKSPTEIIIPPLLTAPHTNHQ